jgi:hypothetical protein
MYALVDTELEDEKCFGRILTVHRTVEAAEGSDLRLQRWAKREAKVLSTVIVAARPETEHKDLKTMFWAFKTDWRECTQ